jgi:hypothetical protein
LVVFGNRRDTTFVAYRQSNLASAGILSTKLCPKRRTKSFSATGNWFLQPVSKSLSPKPIRIEGLLSFSTFLIPGESPYILGVVFRGQSAPREQIATVILGF